MSEKKYWWMTLEERQKKSREERGKPIYGDETYKEKETYARGLKDYLANFEIGEIREYKDKFDWHSLRTTASRMSRDYGCLFSFASQGIRRFIVRIL